MNTELRDALGNMIFKGDKLKRDGYMKFYSVEFGYYGHLDSDTKAYGFYLVDMDYYTEHPIPESIDGHLKLINSSRCE